MELQVSHISDEKYCYLVDKIPLKIQHFDDFSFTIQKKYVSNESFN